MIIVRQVEQNPPEYYRYYDGYRAVFGRKHDAAKLPPPMAEMVLSQLQSLRYDGVRVMGEGERFRRGGEKPAAA